MTLAAGTAVLPVPWRSGSWCRVNGTGSPFGLWRLEVIEEGIQEGSQTGDSRTEKHQESWCHCFSQRSGLLTLWPWELTRLKSSKRPNLKVGNYKDDRWINLQWWEETSVKTLRILKIRMPLPLQRITSSSTGEQGLMENECIPLTESGFRTWIIRNFCELKERVLAQCKETKKLKKGFMKS